MNEKTHSPALLLRADGGGRTGAGHVMRCLALAQAWQDAGGAAYLAAADIAPTLSRRLNREGIEVHEMDCVVGSADDANRTDELASRLDAAWIVADGYQFDDAYQRRVKNSDRGLLAIDDYGQAAHDSADIVLNQNIYADETLYPSRGSATRLLLGVRFSLLRREFQTWRTWQRQIPKVARKILVTMGGSDSDNVTAKIIEALEAINRPGLEAIIVVGPTNPHFSILKLAAEGSPHVIDFRRSVAEMTRMMAWADLCVSAAGSTCWELAFMGTPMIATSLAANQTAVAEGLQEAGAALNMGWHDDVTIQEWHDSLVGLLDDQETRTTRSRLCRSLVDGYGAGRVVSTMQPGLIDQEDFQIRQATARDSEALWKLANEPSVRANSFNPEPIPWSAHEAWFAEKLTSPATCIWIAEYRGMFAGQIRYDRVEKNVAEIGFALHPSVRGRGFGTSMLRQSCAASCQKLEVRSVRGFVMQNNTPSAKAFFKAGFSESETLVPISGHDCRVFEWAIA